MAMAIIKGVRICISATLGKFFHDCTFHAYANRVSTLKFRLSMAKFGVFSCYFQTTWPPAWPGDCPVQQSPTRDFLREKGAEEKKNTWHDDEDVEKILHVLDTLLLACDESGTIPLSGVCGSGCFTKSLHTCSASTKLYGHLGNCRGNSATLCCHVF